MFIVSAIVELSRKYRAIMGRLDNTCTICGGVKTLLIKTEAITVKEPLVISTAFKICYGHDEEKHDGKLKSISGKGNAIAAMFNDYPPDAALISISGGYSGEDSAIYIDQEQALSLLVWLQQEKAKLELLAKEQEA